MAIYHLLLIVALNCTFVSCAYRLRNNIETVSEGDKPTNNLILTPLIKQNKIKEARELSEVTYSGFQDIAKSYSGYFTVDEVYDSNLFFWFFPSSNSENDPVLVWLQGGPGSSSMYGLLLENGPLEVLNNGSIKLREHSWHKNHSVIYIDSPVGTGFSYTNPDGYLQNQTAVGNHLYNALLQFFKVFPELQSNKFFVTGESYGGKYVPALAYTIHKNNPSAEQKINLQGLAIGNGWSDPENQLVRSDYLYQLGLIDWHGEKLLGELENLILSYIRENRWLEATDIENNYFGEFHKISGFDNIYNFLISEEVVVSISSKMLTKMLGNQNVKSAIHVGNATFNFLSGKVYTYLSKDFMQSVKAWISELLNHYKILFYNGQLDICVAYPLTARFLSRLDFSAASEYRMAKRYQWYVEQDLAGYVKSAGNLTEIMVRNAGHMVPSDQPVWALDMITKFTHDLPFH